MTLKSHLAGLLVLLTMVPAHSRPSMICEQTLAPQSIPQRISQSVQRRVQAGRTAVVNYGREVVQTRGLNLVLVPERDTAPLPGQRALRLLTPSEHNRGFIPALVQSLPRFISRDLGFSPHDVTLDRFVSRYVVQIPIAELTERVMGRRMQLSAPLKFIIGTAISIIGYSFYDQITTQMLVEKAQRDLNASAGYYDRLLDYDYRFHELKAEADSQHLPREQLLIMAQGLRGLQRSYYDYMAHNYFAAHNADPAGTDQHILQTDYGQLFFMDIIRVNNDGVPGGLANFIYHANALQGRPSAGVLDRLMQNRHFALHKQEFILNLVSNARTVNDMVRSPDLHDYYDNAASQAFFVQTAARLGRGEISRNQMIQILQTDTFYEDRLAGYQLLGISERAVDNHNQPTEHPLTIEIIRGELAQMH